eukprot:CAMPEP_0119369912 /NCGR_PEP_ID=MMETSP1334-20130426/16366_1 /TAXON_ID=127549 /ORGANISM="Calcidiscus leptoporus, Strain RCC1130" /LENGTH=119 /DNA_ID=CAMNT_0007386857 /DNA_START=967 /DNA_END=1326 /DNA_ORIENTATION=+
MTDSSTGGGGRDGKNFVDGHGCDGGGSKDGAASGWSTSQRSCYPERGAPQQACAAGSEKGISGGGAVGVSADRGGLAGNRSSRGRRSNSAARGGNAIDSYLAPAHDGGARGAGADHSEC